jgi:hypothetical protein
MDNGWLVVCGALTLVLLFNLGILWTFLGRGGRELAARWSAAVRKLVNPWREEAEDFAELNRLVRGLHPGGQGSRDEET